MTFRSAFLSVTLAALVHAPIASAQENEEGEWFSEEAAAEAEAEPEEADSAEPEEKATPAKGEASVEVKGKIDVAVEPERDEPAEKKPRRKGARLHDGFYLRMSIGGGSIGARGERYDTMGSSSDYSFDGNALAFDIAIGGTPARGFVLGGAYQGSYAARGGPDDAEADAGLSLSLAGPFVDLFPDPRDGFHLGGMLGVAATASHDRTYEERSAAVGFGGSVWVGYDFWIGNQWSLGALVRGSAAEVETPQNRMVELERDRLGVASVALLVSAVYH